MLILKVVFQAVAKDLKEKSLDIRRKCYQKKKKLIKLSVNLNITFSRRNSVYNLQILESKNKVKENQDKFLKDKKGKRNKNSNIGQIESIK